MLDNKLHAWKRKTIRKDEKDIWTENINEAVGFIFKGDAEKINFGNPPTEVISTYEFNQLKEKENISKEEKGDGVLGDVSGALPIPKVPKEFCQCKNPLVHDIQCPCGNDR
jgi:hypothetical protein